MSWRIDYQQWASSLHRYIHCFRWWKSRDAHDILQHCVYLCVCVCLAFASPHYLCLFNNQFISVARHNQHDELLVSTFGDGAHQNGGGRCMSINMGIISSFTLKQTIHKHCVEICEAIPPHSIPFPLTTRSCFPVCQPLSTVDSFGRARGFACTGWIREASVHE